MQNVKYLILLSNILKLKDKYENSKPFHQVILTCLICWKCKF